MNKAHREEQQAQASLRIADQWKLFKATKALLNYQCDTPFPPYRDKSVLANDMGDFFVYKNCDICSTLISQNTASILTPEESNSVVFAGPIFTSFSSLTENSLSKLMASAPKMTCLLDPTPTKLVVECSDVLTHTITTMVNLSFQSGHFPVAWNDAIVFPCLK